MKILVAALALFCAAGLQDSVQELLTEFTVEGSHVSARNALLQLPSERVIAPLVNAMRTDHVLMTSPLYRGAAYDVLTRKTVSGKDGRQSYQDSDQIEQIITGLRDSSQPIQAICLRALGRVSPQYGSKAVQSAMPFLKNGDPQVISVAVGVLTELGPASTPALPELKVILVEGPIFPPDYTGDGLVAPKRLAHQIRQAAAFARIAIGGVGVDLETYKGLDVDGRAAAVDALMPVVMSDQMVRNDSKSSIPANSGTPITGEQREKLLDFLLSHSVDTASETPSRTKAILLLGVLVSGKDLADRAKSNVLTRLEELAKDPDPAISAAAKQLLQVIRK